MCRTGWWFPGNRTPPRTLSCLSLHCSDLLVLGGLFDGRLLTDDLLQPLQPGVLGAQVPYACLAAMEQRQGVDVLQLRVADALVHHQIQQLICSVVQHLVVLPEWRGLRGEVRGGSTGGYGWGKWEERGKESRKRGKRGRGRKKQLKTLYILLFCIYPLENQMEQQQQRGKHKSQTNCCCCQAQFP